MVAEALRFLRDTTGVSLVNVLTAPLFPVNDTIGAEDAFDDALVALVQSALDKAQEPGLRQLVLLFVPTTQHA